MNETNCKMFTEGIFPIGDGLLDIDEERLKGLLVPHDINEIYDVEQTPFARGKFAAVRRAIHKNSGVHFAAKFLKRRRRAQSSDKEIKHEIAVLMLCDGADNIVKLNAVHESRSDTALLLELATGGELQTFLDHEECLSESQARICMREVLKALQFLHKRSIVHLDLKPQNILLTGERIQDGLKLCDFGISRVVAEGTNVREIVGTPDYVAPEVLQYEPLSLLTDIWSVGVLAYVLLSGFSPFGGETKQETFLNISQCALTFPEKLFGGVSSAAIDFIRRALRIKPSDRMTAAGCLEHTWLKDDCSIDRQLFSKMAKKSVVNGDGDDHDDEEEDEEEDDDDEEEEENVGEAEESEEEDEIFTDGHNVSNDCRMESSDAEQELTSNGKTHRGRGSNPKSVQGTISKYNGTNTAVVGVASTSPATSAAIAVHTLPADRDTTVPLCNMPQQQQLQQITTRRHSSDSNKENTFLAAKKSQSTASASATKKPTMTVTSTATATIIISPTNELSSSVGAQHIVASIALPNSGNTCSEKLPSTAAVQCLFPDAPTTPKVIRKAPTTETSPTSVKALVKKFQLEGSSVDNKPALHLKETQLNHQEQQQQQQQQQLQHQHQLHQLQYQQQNNGFRSASRLSCTSMSLAGSGKHGLKTPEKYAGGEQSKKFSHSPTGSSSTGTAAVAIASGVTTATTNGGSGNNASTGSRIHTITNSHRLSEPHTVAVYKKLPVSPTASIASAPGTSTASYKSTCAFCLSCAGNGNGKSSTGCGHSAATLNRGRTKPGSTTTSATAASAATSTSTGMATPPISPTSNGSSSSSSTTLLLSSHQELQHHHHHQHVVHSHTHPHTHHHHHHHHHHVARTATNNLNLDQGIIC